MASVDLAKIEKNYGSVQVIKGLDLTIRDGDFTVFVGPSGCGKSTLLRMIAGLEPISGGDVLIRGQRMNDATPVERGVAMVFQNYALYPHMTVEANIGFGLKMTGMRKPDIARRVEQAAKSLQIENLMKRKPSQLSGGQRQRVAIGRAIVREPGVFLFDEPLSNLDAELRVSMRVEIAKLHQRIGATMIYVTHDQTEAMTLADQIVVLRNGQIEQVGAPDTLYRDPDNMFVAGFIGSPRMNFLSGTPDAGDRITIAGKPAMDRPAFLQKHLGAFHIGLRPEHFDIVPESQGQLTLHVEFVENLGGARYLHGNTETGEALVVETRSDARFSNGEKLHLGFRAERALFFDLAGHRMRHEVSFFPA